MWEPHDLWVGCYWKVERHQLGSPSDRRRVRIWLLHVYVCLVPCVPLCLTIERLWREVGVRGGQRAHVTAGGNHSG
jgi:hypothetical protein